MHVVIDGKHYSPISRAYGFAQSRGFAGTIETFYNRIRAGATTWRELHAPIDAGARLGGMNGRETRAKARAEEKALMHSICSSLDARKAAIKADE